MLSARACAMLRLVLCSAPLVTKRAGGAVCLCLLISAVTTFSGASPAGAVDPDDTPWTVNDANPGQRPASIEDLLERDRKAMLQDNDINPPSQDQPEYSTHAQPGNLDQDRLTPALPAEIHRAPDRTPQVAIPARAPDAAVGEKPTAASVPPGPSPAAIAQPDANRSSSALPATTPGDLAPIARVPVPMPARRPVTPAAIDSKSAVPPAVTPKGTGAELAAVSQEPSELSIGPKPSQVPARGPDQTAILHDSADPSAPPPQAVPSAPVETPAVAVNGKLYLPVSRYFSLNGNTVLATYDVQDREALAAFYEKSLGEALWVTRDGFNDNARALIEEIGKAGTWGLSYADYKLPQLTATGVDYDYAQLLDVEIKLSLAALAYARHARGDRIDNPTQLLSSYIDRKPQIVPRSKVLADLVAAPDKGAYLRSLHPKNPQFEALRVALADLRARKATGQETEMIPDGPKVSPGKSHSSIAVLRRRLGTPPPAPKSNGQPVSEAFYDKELAEAVIAYKRKNGIEPANSTVTAELRTHLNTQGRIDEDTIIANMEEWRWMPEDLGETYVWVNVPEFLVRVVKQGQIIHEERIVAGRYETQTPIFSHKLSTVVFQPSWNVPESIKVNELLPKLRAGGNPIASQGLRMEQNGRLVEASSLDWSRNDIRNYHIYQPPGSSNVLGVVKFLFPNKHAVYLHDTPAKGLFNEKLRTFSHGCVRVRNPVQLAEVIMAEDKGWDKDKVAELIASGPADNDVALDKPLPVHITYFTAWAGDGGAVTSYPDIYGHEMRIKFALAGRWDQIIRNPDHLAPADPGAVVSREDWGDEDDDAQRNERRRAPARTTTERRPRQAANTTYDGRPRKNSGTGFSDFMNNVFGSN